MTTPATTQELIADVLLMHLPDDDDAYTAADAILRDPALTVRPRRILTGEWEAVRDTLEALPEGTQIRWTTGMNPRPELAIHRGHRWHCTNGSLPRTSHNIARDNTPIEVIA